MKPPPFTPASALHPATLVVEFDDEATRAKTSVQGPRKRSHVYHLAAWPEAPLHEGMHVRLLARNPPPPPTSSPWTSSSAERASGASQPVATISDSNSNIHSESQRPQRPAPTRSPGVHGHRPAEVPSAFEMYDPHVVGTIANVEPLPCGRVVARIVNECGRSAVRVAELHAPPTRGVVVARADMPRLVDAGGLLTAAPRNAAVAMAVARWASCAGAQCAAGGREGEMGRGGRGGDSEVGVRDDIEMVSDSEESWMSEEDGSQKEGRAGPFRGRGSQDSRPLGYEERARGQDWDTSVREPRTRESES